MRIRYLAIALAVLLVPTAGYADDHFADLYLGGGRTRASSLWGLHETYALTTPEHRPLSFVLGDLGVMVGSHQGRGEGEGRGQGQGQGRGNDATQITYMAGLRYSAPRFADRYMIYGQALIGGISTTAQGNRRDNNLAGAFGGGLDIGLGRGETTHGHLSTKWAVRIHADYIVDGEDTTPWRMSGGVVYRFRK